jgi:hypothetical protein
MDIGAPNRDCDANDRGSDDALVVTGRFGAAGQEELAEQRPVSLAGVREISEENIRHGVGLPVEEYHLRQAAAASQG